MSSDSTARAQPASDPVLDALSGSRDAEIEVCRRLRPAIEAFAHRRLPHAAAEDFVHDVLVLLIQAFRERRVLEPSQVASFSLGICRNLSRERARLNERRQSLLEQFGMSEDDLISTQRPLEVGRAQLEDCFSQLTQRARSIIRATFCHDEADAEIAASLSISQANVRVIRHRSLSALRNCLERPISWVQQ